MRWARFFGAGLLLAALAHGQGFAAPAELKAPAGTPEVELRIGPPGRGPVPATLRYGGGVWRVPKTFLWIAPEILALSGGGSVRAALAWEVLAPSRDAADLERLLREYRLNDFLRELRHRGFSIIVSVDAMPRWLASNRSEERLHDGPLWARSAPRDPDGWSGVVAAVVRHFNGRLGLDACYEVWNEPDGSFHGSLDEYLELYAASVRGARRADPRARLCGPALSDWVARGTPADPRRDSPQLFLDRFLDYAAATGIPALGLARLPVDGLTWHAFYRDPASYYPQVVPVLRRKLDDRGYRDTALLLDEWNIAPTPPYPEGDLNASPVGAAYVVASTIAMDRAGVDGQVFQMLVDPGTEGYSGGTFSVFGVPHPNFGAFGLLSLLEGERVAVSSSHPWVYAAAFQTERALSVICAVSPPSERMLLRSTFEEIAVSDPAALFELQRAERRQLERFVADGGAPPANLSATTQQALVERREAFHARRAERSAWPSQLRVRLRLEPGVRVEPGAAHHVLDEASALSPDERARMHQQLGGRLERGLAEARRFLAERPLSDRALLESFVGYVETGRDPQPLIQRAVASDAERLSRAWSLMVGPFERDLERVQRAERLRWRHPSATLEPQANLAFDARSPSVHLLVFRRER